MYEIKPAQDHPDLDLAELLGVINRMRDANKGLTGIIRSYETMMRGYDGKCAALRDERDRARAFAVTLEQECAACWGPIHSQTIEAARLAMVLWGESDGA